MDIKKETIALKVIVAASKQIVETFKANNATNNRWSKLADDLYGKGLRAHMVDVSDPAKSEEAVAKLKELGVLAFNEEEQRIYNADVKSLDRIGKIARKMLQNTRDANVNKLKTHLKKLEARADGVVLSLTARAHKDIDAAIKKLQKETQVHYSVVDFISDLKAVKAKYPGA